jgi:glyoxylase-like metal-dependent hydrolase (beta-lactamase superfamily II)
MTFHFWEYDDDCRGTEEREAAAAAEIVPGLWYVGSYHVCAYALSTEAGPVVIDTCQSRARDFFFRQLSDAGVELCSVAAILHTHGHDDHTGNTAELVALSGADAIIGAGDAPLLAQQTRIGRMLCPGETVTFGAAAVRFISTPGHTLGCGMYVTQLGDTRLCFMGDACKPDIFRGVRWSGDDDAFRASAERIRAVEADIFLPGHPHDLRDVSPRGDPRLTPDQWQLHIDGRLRALERIVAEERPPSN